MEVHCAPTDDDTFPVQIQKDGVILPVKIIIEECAVDVRIVVLINQLHIYVVAVVVVDPGSIQF